MTCQFLLHQPVYEFSTPRMNGLIRPYGHFHGLVINCDADGRLVTDPGRCFMNLEHYEARKKQGLFVPRDKCQHSYEIGEDWIAIRFSKTDEWKLNSSIIYQIASEDTIDITFEFNFEENFLNFESFIASYMIKNTQPAWIKANGNWTRPEVLSKEQLFVPRDKASAEVIDDQRWKILFERDYAYRIHNEFYDIPVMVTFRDQCFSEPAIIQIIDPRQCFALSPNRFAPAHDFSLIGRDVIAGETITAKARLIYRKIDNFEAVDQIYTEFCSIL